MILDAATKVVYLGDGKTTEFPFTFKFNSPSDIKVAIYDIASQTQAILSKDYYVDSAKSSVFYPGYAPGEEPAANEKPEILPKTKRLVVYRETPVSQLIDLGEKYPLPLVEKIDDKGVMILQEMKEQLNRSVHILIGSSESSEALIAELKNMQKKTIASAASVEEIFDALKTECGVGAWDSTKVYAFPDMVIGADGHLYRCTAESATSTDIPGASSKWLRVTLGMEDFWEVDTSDNMMPTESPSYSNQWELDNENNMRPKGE